MIYLLTLAALLGFFGAMLLFVHKAERWERASLADLVLNRDGRFDIAAVVFWLGFAVSCWVLLYSVFHQIPDIVSGLYPVFVLNIVAPLLAKVIFKTKVPPNGPAA